jgi:hypothetical protein
MTTDQGSKVNILLVVTTVASVLINVGQFVNSWELRKFKERYEVFEKKDKAFHDLSEETASRMAEYRKAVETAVAKVRGLIDEIDEEYEFLLL